MAESQRRHPLDYVELPVADTAAARAFYEAALGWEFHDYGPEYSGIVGGADGGEMGGLRLDDDAAAAPLPGVCTEDLDASYAAVKAAGGVITVEPFDFPGGRRFQFRDPDGNELNVYTKG